MVKRFRIYAALAAWTIAALCFAPSGAPAQTVLHGRALALTGGGATGTAWETGVLLGLQRSGIDVNAADVVIGTSAGSIVGAEMRSGTSLDDLYRAQVTADASVLATWSKNVDPAYMQATRALYVTDHALSQAERAAVGARALAAKLPSEAEWLPRHRRTRRVARKAALDRRGRRGRRLGRGVQQDAERADQAGHSGQRSRARIHAADYH